MVLPPFAAVIEGVYAYSAEAHDTVKCDDIIGNENSKVDNKDSDRDQVVVVCDSEMTRNDISEDNCDVRHEETEQEQQVLHNDSKSYNIENANEAKFSEESPSEFNCSIEEPISADTEEKQVCVGMETESNLFENIDNIKGNEDIATSYELSIKNTNEEVGIISEPKEFDAGLSITTHIENAEIMENITSDNIDTQNNSNELDHMLSSTSPVENLELMENIAQDINVINKSHGFVSELSTTSNYENVSKVDANVLLREREENETVNALHEESIGNEQMITHVETKTNEGLSEVDDREGNETVNTQLEESIGNEQMISYVETNINEGLSKVDDIAQDGPTVYVSANDTYVESVNELKTSTENIGVSENTNESININVLQTNLDEPKNNQICKEQELENSVDETKGKIDGAVAVESIDLGQLSTAAAAHILENKVVSNESVKTSEDIKKSSIKPITNASKAKTTSATSVAAKKPNIIETMKKPSGAISKTKLAPTKTTSTVGTDKKPSKPLGTTTTARKPINSGTTTVNKLATKTTTPAASIRGLPPTAPTTRMPTKSTTTTRTVTSVTAARKPTAPLSTSATKPRTLSSVASKPTTLGVTGTNTAAKSKVTSPRASSTSQIRKTVPSSIGLKSPVKPPSSNIQTKSTTSAVGSRAKISATNTSTTITKQFTARPAPKSTNTVTATTTTTRRLTVGGTTSSNTTQITTTKTSANATQRKSSPIKPVASKTPTKTANTTTGAKTTKSTIKSTPQKSTSTEQKVNTHNTTAGDVELNGTTSPTTLPIAENTEHIVPNINDPSNTLDGGSTGHMQIDLNSA